MLSGGCFNFFSVLKSFPLNFLAVCWQFLSTEFFQEKSATNGHISPADDRGNQKSEVKNRDQSADGGEGRKESRDRADKERERSSRHKSRSSNKDHKSEKETGGDRAVRCAIVFIHCFWAFHLSICSFKWSTKKLFVIIN